MDITTLRGLYVDEARSLNFCAKHFNTTRQAIKKALAAADIPMTGKKQHKKVPIISENEILELYASGKNMVEITKRAECSGNTISDIINKAGIKRTTQAHELPKPTKKELEDLYKICTLTDMAAKYSTSIPTIKKWIRYYDIEMFRSHSDTIRAFAVPSAEKSCMKKHGVTSLLKIPEMQEKMFKARIANGFKHSPHSKGELELLTYLNELTYENMFAPDRSILNGREIDCFSCELKIGIEYCGLYYHNESSPTPKDRNYHYDKFNQCRDQNIQLLTIFEDEWINRKAQIKGFIRSLLGKNEHKIYGRKCVVEKISKTIAVDFINMYHIQPITTKNVTHSIGIFHDGVLYGAMTFAHHHRGNDSMVLNRMVFKSNYTIIGGASKLFKAAIKEFDLKNIVSWSDNRFSLGNVYEKLGFTRDSDLRPDYSYVNGGTRIPKQACTRTKLGCVGSETEYTKAKSLGLYRIWDCGKIRWTYCHE